MTSIEGDCGGRPYDDIVKCFEYVEKNVEYVDTSNAVALGGKLRRIHGESDSWTATRKETQSNGLP